MRTLAVMTGVFALWCAIVFWSSSAFSQSPVLVGASVAQSGMLADLAREYVRGIELWRDDVNARGGLAGRPVELRLFDDGSGARRAAEVVGVLIAEDQVDLLIGPFGSAATVSAAVVADRERRIMVNAAGPAPNIHKRTLRYVFQLQPPPADFALPVLKLASLLGKRPITVFSGSGSGGVLERLREEAKLAGIALSELSALPEPTLRPANYPPLIAKLDSKALLLVFDEVPRLADLVQQMRLAGFRPPAFVAPNSVDPEFIRRVGMDAEYAFGVSEWEPRALTRGNAQFVRAFQSRHKQPPNANAARGWAAGQLLEAALLRAGSLETERMREALAALETDTVLGAYKVDVNGGQLAATSMLVQILKGRREVVWPDAYRSAEPVLAPPPWPGRR